MDELNVITDAELINKYGKQLMEEPAASVKTQAPSSSEVSLTAGVVLNGELVNTAEVRELTGEDEEVIARAGSLGKALITILNRGVVSIGGVKATEDVLDSLYAGDRDLLMLAIHKVTFGSKFSASIMCNTCSKVVDVELDTDTDVPTTKFDGRTSWTVETKLGLVSLSFYKGSTQKRLLDNIDKTPAEISTIILSGCINSLDGAPVVPVNVAKSLGMSDRQALLGEVLTKAPGPRLSEVSTACKACGTELSAPLSLASLFRL